MPARQSWVSARDGGISVSLARHDRTTVTRRKWLMEKTAEMEYGQAVRRKQVRRVARIEAHHKASTSTPFNLEVQV